MSHALQSIARSRRRVGRRVGVLAVGTMSALMPVIALSPGPAGAASGTGSGNGGGGSVGLVTPLLKFFEFGNTIGLPLLCSDGGSVVSIIGTQSGAAAVSSPLVTQLDNDCAKLSAAGDKYLQQAIVESQSLALINPVVNPLLAELSTTLANTGANYGAALAPFGPTVAGLGGTVAFFEGS
ncbi:MAG TPA: hypothetical protein VGF87_10730 [Acidimicrobiales bacterium]